MTHHTTSRRAWRTQLLASAGIVLATMLATAATAQSIDATATRSAINQQTSSGGATSADASRTGARTQLSAAQGSAASITDNEISATARDNSATTSLTPDIADSEPDADTSALSIATFAVAGRADTLLASSQRMASSPVQASLLGADAGLSTGGASSATLSVTGNDFEASALGNQASDTLSLGESVTSGAGIVSLQYGDASSSVSANNPGATQLTATRAAASTLTLNDNLSRAAASGNVATDALSVLAGSVTAAGSSTTASVVPSMGGGSDTVDAVYANLGKQVLPGQVSATVGTSPSSFTLGLAGALDASLASANGNALVATGNGNQSLRSIDLKAGDIAAPGSASGPATIANVTGVQRVLGANVGATTNGGASIDIDGHVSAGNLSASQNALRATATGNRADGNLLSVSATSIDTGELARLDPGAVGTAKIASDGTASATAAFSVQNVQDISRSGVSAALTSGTVLITTTGTIDQSALSAKDNIATAAGTGNSAVNGLAISGGTLRSSYDLNNAQTVDGNVGVQVGAAGDRAGTKLEPVAAVTGSNMLVSGNGVSGVAVGSTASNSLAVSGTMIGDGSGHGEAAAGALDSGYGAAADVALASYQKLGQPLTPGSASPTSSVLSNVTGKFAIGGDATTSASTLSIDGNSQRAMAVGNTALDRLSLNATSAYSGHGAAAGTALASSQYGEGTVGAHSDMLVIARGGVDNSSVTMTGNSNQAVAAINDVDNGLAVSAVQLGGVTSAPAHADVGSLGSATIVGDHVLSSTQFATGSVGAAALTTLVNSDADATMSGSQFVASDNSTVSDASANHAVDAVSVSGLNGAGNAGLANSQMSAATVASNASVNGTLGLDSPPAGVAIYGSSASIDGNVTQAVARGNSADNTLVFTGQALPAAGDPAASTGSFETTATAPALLVNGQSNYGAVTAGATGSYGIPLNATGSVLSSSLGVTGNSVSATAYGNAATSHLTLSGIGAMPGAMLTSVQNNSGPVSAMVTGANFAGRTGQLGASSLSINGNQLAASATGNLAISTITGAR